MQKFIRPKLLLKCNYAKPIPSKLILRPLTQSIEQLTMLSTILKDVLFECEQITA